MNTEGIPHHEEIDSEWKEVMREGIEDSLDNFELLYEPSRDEVYSPFVLSPITLSEGFDEREYSELSDAEKEYLKKQLFSKLQVDETPEVVGDYEFQSTDETQSKTTVRILKTGRSDEGLFLHEIQREGSTEYIVASEDYRL